MNYKEKLRSMARKSLDPISFYFESRLIARPRWSSAHPGVLQPLDVRKFAQFYVALEAGEFYAKNLYNGDFFEDYLEHIREMAKRAGVLGPGAFLEFGVASGRTIRVIAAAADRQVVGFDWFEGLPENWRSGVETGAFAGAIPEVPANVALEIGRIEKALPVWLERESPAEINFIHIDTDLYTPAKIILEACAPSIRDAIIVFDEYYNYPGWREHEFKAFEEFRQTHPEFDVNFVGAGGTAAVSVRVTRRSDAPSEF